PFQRTAASGTLPIEQTKLTTEISGPMNGPQIAARAGSEVRNSRCQTSFGTHAARAPAMSRPAAMSFQIAAQSMTNEWLIAVKPAGEVIRCRSEPSVAYL